MNTSFCANIASRAPQVRLHRLGRLPRPAPAASRRCLVLATLLALAAQAQVCPVGERMLAYPQYKVAWQQGSKCPYFDEFEPSRPPRERVYTKQTSHFTASRLTYASGTNVDSEGWCWSGPGPWSQSEGYQHDITEVTRFLKFFCEQTNTYSGTRITTSESEDSRGWVCDNPNDGCQAEYTSYHYDRSTNFGTATTIFTNGAFKWLWSTTSADTSAVYCVSCPCSIGTGWVTSASSTTSTSIENTAPFHTWALTSQTPTQQWYSLDDGDGATGTKELTLEDEYTDQDLYDAIMSQMPGYPEEWYAPTLDSDEAWRRVAYSWIYDGGHKSGELQKMKYRFAVPNSEAGTTYTVHYLVLTWKITTGELSGEPKTVEVSATGSRTEPAYSHEISLPPPGWDDSPWGGFVISWIDDIYVTASSSRTVPGAGPYLSSDGCSGCSSLGPLLLSDASSAAPFAGFGLGVGTGGRTVGSLQLGSTQPSLALATPGSLQLSQVSSELQIVTASNQFRQLSAPQALVDIIVLSPFSYEARYYLRSQFTAQTNSAGLFEPIGAPTPFVTWKLENPDASTNTFNRLQITETRGGDVKTCLSTYNAASGTWTLAYPGSLREDEVSNVITTNSNGYVRTVTTIVRPPGGSAVYKLRRVYEKIGTLYNGSENLIEEILSPDSNPQTTTYSYYANYHASGTLKPIKQVIHPDGSWQFFQYTSGGVGRVYRVYSGLGDTPAPGATPPDTSTCRYTQYDYIPLVSGDDGSLEPYSPRTTTTYLRSQLIAKSYLVALPGERREIRCQDPYAAWDASDNLVTVTRFYTNGPNLNRIQSVQREDGTMAFYDYAQAADGSQTNTVSSGQPDPGRTAISNGTSEVTVLGPFGELVSRTVTDAATGLLVGRDLYSAYDDFRRPQAVTNLDATVEITHYACCGIDYSTDRDGVTNYFGYDALRRRTSTTRLGITSTDVLDAAGRTLKTIRTGSDATQMTLFQQQFDLAGQLLAETNALGGSTSYSESTDASTGGLIRTTTYPDGGIRIESYYLDGSLKRLTGTAVHQARYEQDVDLDLQSPDYGMAYSEETKLDASGTDTGEWSRTYSDLLGRPYKTHYADGSYSRSYYNNSGQLWKEVDPDGVVALYQYGPKGELLYTATDMNRNDAIDFSGTDRVTSTISDVATDNGTTVRRTRTYVWDVPGVNASNLVSVSETSADGLRSWHTTYRDASTPITSHSRIVYAGSGVHHVTNTAPDGSYSVSTYQSGRLASGTHRDSTGNQVSSTSSGFDPHGRQSTVTDARNGTTCYYYNAADLVTNVTTPSPGIPGSSPQTTRTFYSQMLQATSVLNPDGTSTYTEFYPTGLRKKTYGSRIYPVEYTYDYAGRMSTMKTWQNFAADSGLALTAWNYDPYRGWLINKVYADGKGPIYSNTPAGRLALRVWARGTNTVYAYNNAGDLESVSYLDSTPGVAYTFDRLGRRHTVTFNGTTTTFNYNLAGELLSESYSGGSLSGLTVTNTFDQFMRRTNVSLLNGAAALTVAGYSYGSASRLQAVTDGGSSVTYSYIANSALVGQIAFTNNGVRRMVTTKAYDFLNRLTQISSTPSAPPAPPAPSAISSAYAYNDANQRTRLTLADGSYWVYTYDALGQVRSGKKFWADGTPVASQQFEYAFDDIGNRTSTKAGGDENGLNLRSATYSRNSLNQYTSRDVPGYVDILGLSYATNTVTVNGQAAYRKWEYFRKELAVDNSSSALWTNITVAATGQTSVSGHQYVPKTPQAFGYDYDGNLTNDSRWIYTWDAENRLVGLTPNIVVGPQCKIAFDYDWQGRRIRKQVWDNAAGAGNPTNDVRFVYDGWNLIGILNSSLNLQRSFVWGLDLSGSMQGAGGVGGLLAIHDAAGTVDLVAYDGNGNVAALISAADGSVSARYEHGPFGELLRATGPMAKANPFRFSTKYEDDETDLVYYGYRYYTPSSGRWISSDPGGHKGGPNLYACALNVPTCLIDPLGLESRIGGSEAWASPKDVVYLKKKIGTVQVWKNVTVAGQPVTSGIWIQFDKATSSLNCKWAQFVLQRVFDAKGSEVDDTIQVGYLANPYYRTLKTWYADIKKENRSPWYEPSVSTEATVSIWDDPEGRRDSATISKSIMEFQSCLFCRSVECMQTDPYVMVFNVSWKATFPSLEPKIYEVESGESTSKLPEGFTGKDWVKGLDADKVTKLTVRSPVFYGEGW